MRTTLKDVALEAGVGMSTASYVINATGLHKVSQKTQERILAAAKKLNYHPNIIARGLQSGRSCLIGVLVPEIHNSFMPKILAGIDNVLSQSGYSMVLCTYSSSTEFAQKVHILLQKQVEGLIIKSWSIFVEPVFKSVISNQLPCVFVAGPGMPEYPAALVNPVKIGKLAAQCLLDYGHRKIAIYNLSLAPDGVQALLQELETARIPKPLIFTKEASPSETLFAKRKDFTAVLSSGYYVIQILQEALKHKIQIPEDFSVLGINGLEMADLTLPRLTSIIQPHAEQGQAAAEMVLKWINTGKRPQSRLLQPTLRERESIVPNHV